MGKKKEIRKDDSGVFGCLFWFSFGWFYFLNGEGNIECRGCFCAYFFVLLGVLGRDSFISSGYSFMSLVL